MPAQSLVAGGAFPAILIILMVSHDLPWWNTLKHVEHFGESSDRPPPCRVILVRWAPWQSPRDLMEKLMSRRRRQRIVNAREERGYALLFITSRLHRGCLDGDGQEPSCPSRWATPAP